MCDTIKTKSNSILRKIISIGYHYNYNDIMFYIVNEVYKLFVVVIILEDIRNTCTTYMYHIYIKISLEHLYYIIQQTLQ